MSGSYEYRISAADTSSCEFCGESHLGQRCHYVKKLERYENGAVKMVEFFSNEELYAKVYPSYTYPIQDRSPWQVGDFPNHVVVGGPQVTTDAWATRGVFGPATVTTTAPASGEYLRPAWVRGTYGTSGRGNLDFNTLQDFEGMPDDIITQQQLAAILRDSLADQTYRVPLSAEALDLMGLGGDRDS